MSKRSDFPIELPMSHTKYCFFCVSTSVEKISTGTKDDPRTEFRCNSCQKISSRVRIWDPNMIQYFDTNNNLIHEGAGMIIVNDENKILLFLRTKYPFLWTIPGGHMSPNENPKAAALREAIEETGIPLTDAEQIFEGMIEGDECMGGADIHKWHLYRARATDTNVRLDEEGSRYQWFSLSDIPKNVTFPVHYLLSLDSVKSALESKKYGT